MLHALQEVLVVGDVEHQRQLRRVGLAGHQRRVVDAIVGTGVLQAVQAGGRWQGDTWRVIEPALPGRADTQCKIGLAVELGAQLGFVLGE